MDEKTSKIEAQGIESQTAPRKTDHAGEEEGREEGQCETQKKQIKQIN